jgi:hypothetical protein
MSSEQLLAKCTPSVRNLAQLARKRVLSIIPTVEERVRAGWGLIGYNAPAYFAFIAPKQDHVIIGFERGILLPDPQRVLEGSGSQVRHVTIRSRSDLESPALAQLLRAAAAPTTSKA